MHIATAAAAAVAALMLAACQPAAEDAAAPAPEAATEAELQATLSSPVLLDAAGLQVQAAPGAEVRTVAMGAPQGEAVAAVSQALGQPRETGTMEECGAGAMDYAIWDRGFEMMFQGGALAGWQSTADDLNTARDIHAGSSVEDLRAAYPEVEIQETTVGWAFIIGDIYGLLDESQTRVEMIRQGVNCDAH